MSYFKSTSVMLLYYSQEWFDYDKTLTSYVMNGMETDLQSPFKSLKKKKKPLQISNSSMLALLVRLFY